MPLSSVMRLGSSVSMSMTVLLTQLLCLLTYVSLLEMNDASVLRLNGSASDVDLIYTEGQSQPLLLATNATITGLCTYCSMYQD